MKNAEKSVNSSLVETYVNEATVDFNVAANSVQDSVENLVNDGEQPGPSLHIMLPSYIQFLILVKKCSKNKNSTTNVYETNLCSVMHQTMGRAGLVNFCNIMDLAQPVNKTP